MPNIKFATSVTSEAQDFELLSQQVAHLSSKIASLTNTVMMLENYLNQNKHQRSGITSEEFPPKKIARHHSGGDLANSDEDDFLDTLLSLTETHPPPSVPLPCPQRRGSPYSHAPLKLINPSLLCLPPPPCSSSNPQLSPSPEVGWENGSSEATDHFIMNRAMETLGSFYTSYHQTVDALSKAKI
jgi:hypothetical protein